MHKSLTICGRSLGQSAIETASVALLQANDAQSVESTLQRQKLAKRFSKHERRESRNIGPSVPAAFLLSLRGASQKFERPLWEMVLLQQTSLPLPMEWVCNQTLVHLLVFFTLIVCLQCFVCFCIMQLL